MNRNLIIGFGVMTLVIVAGLFFGKNEKPNIVKPSSSPSTSSETTSTPDTGMRQIVITAKEFSLGPETIEVEKGETVRLVLDNGGSFAHNLVIPKLNLKSPNIAAGETGYLVFSSEATGSFEFYCSIEGHKDFGMKGIIVVK